MTNHPTREGLWDAGERYFGRVLRPFSADLMRRVLLPHAEARVTTDGIMVRGRAFSCARAEAEKWFYRGVRGAPRMIKVIEDPLRRGRVWRDAGSGRPLEPCWLLPGSEDFEDLQLIEAEMWATEEAKRVANAKDEHMGAQVLYAFQQPAIAKRARSRVRAQKKVSAAQLASATQTPDLQPTSDEMNDEERAILARIKKPQ